MRDLVVPGAIFTTEERDHRVVVTYVREHEHRVVFADDLPFDGSGMGYCGGDPVGRFLRDFPSYEGQMKFEGAWKLYRKAVRRSRESVR